MVRDLFVLREIYSLSFVFEYQTWMKVSTYHRNDHPNGQKDAQCRGP